MATLADGPDVEVVELHIWVDGLNLRNESVRIYVIRRLLHQNPYALFRDRKNGEANQDRENEGANRVGNFPLRPVIDDRSGNDDPNRHDHVAESVKIGGIHIHVRLGSMATMIARLVAVRMLLRVVAMATVMMLSIFALFIVVRTVIIFLVVVIVTTLILAAATLPKMEMPLSLMENCHLNCI